MLSFVTYPSHCDACGINALSFFNRTKYSLNEISHDSAIGLIKLLQSSGVNVHEVGILGYLYPNYHSCMHSAVV